MTRLQIIKKIFKGLDDKDIVVASTGYISRAIFEHRDRPLNFYMMGSMGNALAIGLGLALNVPNRVIVVSGDGAVLMGLGSIVTREAFDLPNLEHHIINNNCHESTGGQPTNFRFVDLSDMQNTYVYHIKKDSHIPPRITLSPEEITERFRYALHGEQVE